PSAVGACLTVVDEAAGEDGRNRLPRCFLLLLVILDGNMDTNFRDRNAPEMSEPAAAPGRTRGRLLRWAVSLWLVFHLSALIIAPASVSPSSDFVRSAWNVFRPYLQVLYLNHGYHFFAPEPSESTLLGFVAERPDGSVIRGRIPNREIKPRLLY